MRPRIWIGAAAVIVAIAVAVTWTIFHVVSGPGDPLKTVAGVFYVPGCGDDPLELDGTTWYPISPVTDGDFRANPPTPGDGQGTITIYANGRAYFVTGAGTYHSWLTTTPQDYSGVC